MVSHKGTAVVVNATSGRSVVYAHQLAAIGYDLILIAAQQRSLHASAKRLTDRTRRSVETLVAHPSDDDDLAKVTEILLRDASITLMIENVADRGDWCQVSKRLAEIFTLIFRARGVGVLIQMTGKINCPLAESAWFDHLGSWEHVGAIH